MAHDSRDSAPPLQATASVTLPPKLGERRLQRTLAMPCHPNLGPSGWGCRKASRTLPAAHRQGRLSSQPHAAPSVLSVSLVGSSLT